MKIPMQQRTSTVNLLLCWLLLFFVCLLMCGWLVSFVFVVEFLFDDGLLVARLQLK